MRRRESDPAVNTTKEPETYENPWKSTAPPSCPAGFTELKGNPNQQANGQSNGRRGDMVRKPPKKRQWPTELCQFPSVPSASSSSMLSIGSSVLRNSPSSPVSVGGGTSGFVSILNHPVSRSTNNSPTIPTSSPTPPSLIIPSRPVTPTSVGRPSTPTTPVQSFNYIPPMPMVTTPTNSSLRASPIDANPGCGAFSSIAAVSSPTTPNSCSWITPKHNPNLREPDPMLMFSNPSVYSCVTQQPTSTTTTTTSTTNVGFRSTADFTTLRALSAGSYGEVTLVRETGTGREYALKRMVRNHWQPGTNSMQEQLREVQSLASSHQCPFINKYVDAWVQCDINDSSAETLYILTEYCPQGTIAEAYRGGLEEAKCWLVLWQLAAALHHLHSRGIAHLDVKPDNCFVTDHPVWGTRIHQLGDLGTAQHRAVANLHPTAEVNEGDGRYADPHVLNCKKCLATADIYSLALTIIALGTGEVPHDKGSLLNKEKLMPNHSADLNTVLRTMLDPVPAKRPTAYDVLNHPALGDSWEDDEGLIFVRNKIDDDEYSWVTNHKLRADIGEPCQC
eukprot:TRINITY_DN65626_c5_g1_i1.p1 TRINITY_DN65626_c5_g1~~TRINITY_DN65626_c5_g1_i1.p1  ORF type:complete len:606 (+),score=22.83 TRINITY_DN65626_c5_g1_i1:133-1818(+)